LPVKNTKNTALKTGKNDAALIPVLNTFKLTTFSHLEHIRNQARNQGGAGGAEEKFSPPPWKNVLDRLQCTKTLMQALFFLDDH